jgi:hypothetical protein
MAICTHDLVGEQRMNQAIEQQTHFKKLELVNAPTEASYPIQQVYPVKTRMRSDGTEQTAFLDGCARPEDLAIVIKRATLASTLFGVATCFIVATCVAAFHMTFIYIGPLGAALIHALSIINFVVIMVPFAILMSWIYRYNHGTPYRQATINLCVGRETAFDLCLASLAGLRIEKITEADPESGRIRAVGSRGPKFGKQEISFSFSGSSNTETCVTVESFAKLNAIEALLFGYTLAVDSGQNIRNVEHVLKYLRRGGIV